MAFENLSNKLQEVFKQLRSKGVLTEADVKAAMREVKIALLEADVNFKIVKEFIKKVTERAVGTEVLQGLNPGQQVIKNRKRGTDCADGLHTGAADLFQKAAHCFHDGWSAGCR